MGDRSVSKFRGKTSTAGYLVLDELGVALRGGGYAQSEGSTTGNPFFGDYNGTAVASGFYERNENGSYTFTGFACLGLPKDCVLNEDGTFDSNACVDPKICSGGTR